VSDENIHDAPTSPYRTDAALLGLPPRYVVGELLGAGGMGEVRACRDEHVGRTVAVKALRPGAEAARFMREARIQGQLEHPSIVPVYDLGGDTPETTWFTMRRVRGVTLAEALAAIHAGDAQMAARFPRRRLLTAFTSTCLTVHFAHSRGVLHRDLKPDNIMLGEFGEVLVLDWGVARELKETGWRPTEEPMRLLDEVATTAGHILGTPGFIAPELLVGGQDEIDVRADVYALGAILFEILTYEPLVEGATPTELLAATLAGPVARPSLRAAARDVPPELEEICVRASAFDRDERYASARDLSEAVERFLDGDRDMALRAALADRHEEAARSALAEVSAPGGHGLRARARAMRELGAALAFAPDRGAAAAMLARLILEPPVETPPEVEAQLAENMARERARGARLLPLASLTWLLCGPLLIWMGVRSIAYSIFTTAAVCGGLVIALLFAARGRMSVAQGIVLLASNVISLTLFTGIFGPLVMVPTTILATFVFYALLGAVPKLRVPFTAAALGCFLVPLGLEAAGVLPASTVFDGDHLIITARVVGFSPIPAWTLLIIGTVTAVGMTLLFIHRVRGDLWRAERQLLVQAWHHEQLAAGPAGAQLLDGSRGMMGRV
jgi:serine/threonine-protein kinase